MTNSYRLIPLVFKVTVCFLILCGCSEKEKRAEVDTNFTRWVGDIKANDTIDSPNFKLCGSEDHLAQYFNFRKGFQFEGGREELVASFNHNFEPLEDNTQNGLIRIRFIVNCKGQAGRFRVLEADQNYQPKKFNPHITNQLINITKSLKGWIIQTNGENTAEYYQYLIFKIENGHISEIIP